ncbi:hypothetical protein FB451DRAFT_1560684 [Mycena latifolia]|nr:hypothetical protein FB451DRAFT_1560684 [Mycena latifolia]
MSSPFTSRLGTNYCPKEEEIVEIQTLLVQPMLRLKDLDDEIADLQKALDKLAGERAKLSAYVDAHRALISPARRLPLDVVQEIFVACLPAHRNCVMSAVEAPVLLGRICSSWRSLSLSIPRLWSRLHVVEPKSYPELADVPSKEKLAQRLEATKMWLGRSGQCPLSLSVQCAFDSTGTESDTQILQVLFPFASRWEHITLTVDPSILAHLTEADVPMLKSVELKPTGDAVEWGSLKFLRGLAIYSVKTLAMNFTPSKVPLRWERLTDLTIRMMVWDDFMTSEAALQIFSQCPQLRTCRLDIGNGPDLSSRATESIFKLPFLHTLELQSYGTLSLMIPELFNRLSLPQLQNLTLCGSFAPASENISYGPLLAAAPHVENLHLDIMAIVSWTALANFLRDLPPALPYLEITQYFKNVPIRQSATLDDKIFESLIPSPEFPTPCPELRVLKIAYPCSISDETLIRFIKSRTLKRVALSFQRAMDLDIHSELQPLVQSGLQLDLTYNPPVFCFSPWEGLADEPNV